MQKIISKQILVVSGLAVVFIAMTWLIPAIAPKPVQKASSVTPTSAQTKKNVATFSYGGKDGTDALTLLKQQTTVEQDRSGLVVSINNSKADAKKREYWSFYVNGTMASVGPADYVTKNTDKIEWKLENY